MKKKFIVPELKRIEINLSNDIAANSTPLYPADDQHPIWVWTWQYSVYPDRSASCSSYVKGGQYLSQAVVDDDMTLDIVQGHVNAHDAAEYYGGKLDQCMYNWYPELTAEGVDSTQSQGQAIYLGLD